MVYVAVQSLDIDFHDYHLAGKRKRRDASPIDYRACSVRVTDHEPKGTTLEMTVILVCKNSPDKTFICEAMLADGKVESCAPEGGKSISKPPPTTAPALPNLR